MEKTLSNIALIELEEIEINIKIKIQRGKIIVLDVPYEDEEVYTKVLEHIKNLSLPEDFNSRALPEGLLERKEIIKLIEQYIERALLHLKNADKIIKEFL